MALPARHHMTVADLDAMPDDGNRYELIDGTLLVTPAPNPRHQECVVSLIVLLGVCIPANLSLYCAPIDWDIAIDTRLEPDILVVRNEDVTRTGIGGTPLLVVEVLSPSTRRIDLGTKRLTYAEAGVTEYWIVDPRPGGPSLTVYRLHAGSLDAHGAFEGEHAYETATPVPVRVVPRQLLR